MSRFLGYAIITGMIFVTILFAGTAFNDSAAQRAYSQAAYMDAWGRAQAMIITAQGEAQRDFTIAAMPWVVLGIAMIAGAVSIAIIVRVPASKPGSGAALIERRIIYYLPDHPNHIDWTQQQRIEVEQHERNQMS